MSPGDLVRNVQPESQSLPAGAYRASKKGLEQTLLVGWRKRLAVIGDAEIEMFGIAVRPHPDGVVG